jgi:integrase
MASIRKRGTKYEVQFRRKGFATVTRSFLKLSDAKEWGRTVELKADRNELSPNKKTLDSITLAELVERYRDTVVPSLKGAARETITLNAFLRQPMCRKTLAELTTVDFANYRDEQLKTVTAKSLQRMLSPISRMFRIAADEWEIPVRSPLAKLRLKVVDNKRQRRLGPGELDLLLSFAGHPYQTGRNLKAVRSRNPYLPLVIEFAVETALRRGEMLALRWTQVSLQQRSATILEAKNGHSRVIPLSSKAVIVLEFSRMIEPVDRDRVFPVSANGFRLSWERLVKRAEIDDLHFHDLRHEAISRLFELGLTAPEVASISGHRTVSQLFRYAHPNHANVRAKMS